VHNANEAIASAAINGDLFSYCSTVGLAAGGHAKSTTTSRRTSCSPTTAVRLRTHNATEVMVFDGTAVMEGFVAAWTGSRYDISLQ